ncbi:cytochrome P450 [Gymnopus androsaceus JB14]|uniref:Cytochrome P450 n=1 Tax=Gymnopus androsaceus JB14 TaxID=1447944 RepID=A0A6A4HDX4_9AGAR|nr:cytochrome P450 [Gymnopus androsaceus JB14]
MSHNSLLGNILPRIPGISRGKNAGWKDKYQPYAEAGWDVVANISILPSPQVTLSLADAAAIKEVTASRIRFPKPVWRYGVLSFWGDNIVASEAEEWKRYRKVAAPAFSDKNNKLIWDETLRIMFDLFDDVWGSEESISVENALSLTFAIALYVLSAAAFGQRISWKDEDTVPENHQLSFKVALSEVSTNCLTKIIVPSWAMGFNAHTRKVRLAFDELESYMLDMISSRRNTEKKAERHDLFSSLLNASVKDPTFTDRDLMGNIFIFLLAGHETTAHSLCFTFALLALYPEQQELLFQHIKSVLPDGRMPTYEDIPLLTYSMAVLNETMRLFPPATSIPKYSAEDTSITITNAAGEKRVVPIPQRTEIELNIVGMHYNPHHWKDPEEFRPGRFLEPDWPRDAFIPFSAGPRACIGRKFSETEGIAVLTSLILKYKIEILEEPQFVNESFRERKARVLATKQVLTLAPARLPLTFKRR